MSFTILGIGTKVPTAISQEKSAELAKMICGGDEKQKLFVDTLFRKMHIESRNSVLMNELKSDEAFFFAPKLNELDYGPSTEERMERYRVEAFPLAQAACEEALMESGITARDITHLVIVTCTGFVSPGIDIALIKHLNLNSDVARLQVGFMGCHGAVNGLRVASDIAAAHPHAKVLLCAVELCSLHFYYGWNTEKMIANGLFADGAAALVGSGGDDPFHGKWQVAQTGSFLFPNSEDVMSWKVGNHGFEMTLSLRLPELIREHLPSWLHSWLRKHHLKMEDIYSWAIHPGGPKILSEVRNALNLPLEATASSEAILLEHGNMSSPTVLFILKRMIALKSKPPCMMMAFGPGIVVEGCLFF